MILDKIIRHKHSEVAACKRKLSFEALKKRTRPRKNRSVFVRALSKKGAVAVIAEIKRRSPSKGLIRKNFNPAKLATAYEEGGASAISVLTDKKFFGGCLEDLKKVRHATRLPILRKDFVIDEYQIYEACLAGADAILLISAVLSTDSLRVFSVCAKKLGMDVLFEVHDAADLKKVLPLKPALIGINNRDLQTFSVDLATTEKLAKKLPKNVILVSESGIFTAKDIARVRRSGAQAVLVGESLMRSADVKTALQTLLGVRHDSR